MALIDAQIIPGYGVALGQGRDLRFKDGPITMRTPHLAIRGLDISSYFP